MTDKITSYTERGKVLASVQLDARHAVHLYTCGSVVYTCDDKPHRDVPADLPAILWADGTASWYTKGRRQRRRNPDKPVSIQADGTRLWWDEASGMLSFFNPEKQKKRNET